MSVIVLDDRAQLKTKSGLQGIPLQIMLEIGDLARRLQWSASYDTKTRVLKFQKGVVESFGYICADNTDVMQAILDIVKFAWRAQYANTPHELLDQISTMLEEISSLQTRVDCLENQQFVPTDITTAIPALHEADACKVVLLSTQAAEQDATNRQKANLDRQIDQLAAMAYNIGGIVTWSDQQCKYLRPSSLADKTPYDSNWQHMGLRYYFWVPDELGTLEQFIQHDQDLMFGRLNAQKTG